MTYKIPGVPIEKFKRTKIIATIGPATNSYESVCNLIKAGANAIRLNFSHGTHEERVEQIKWVRKASKELGKPVAIIQDLQGPKIRLGDFDGVFTVQVGQSFALKYNADFERSGILPIQYDLAKKVKRGERLFLYDGKVRTTVTSVVDGVVHVRADNHGILIKRKGITLPDTDFGNDIITAKDKKDITFGSTQDIDYVALSFVQSASDIHLLQTHLKNLGSTAKVIAKIETQAAIDNIEKIFEAADVIMIARGDLAAETSPESIPVLQRKMIGLGLKHKKPTIVATQMLMSMTEEAEPTRAEVSDIATAVIVGADCVMLSEETAAGKHPIEAVQVMKRVIMYTQENSPLRATFDATEDHSRQSAITSAVVNLSKSLSAKAIVTETKSGDTALQTASYRPDLPIIAVTSDKRVAQQLTIVYGTKSYIRPTHRLAATKLTDWLRHNKVLTKGDVIIMTAGKYPGVVGTTDTIKVRVIE